MVNKGGKWSDSQATLLFSFYASIDFWNTANCLQRNSDLYIFYLGRLLFAKKVDIVEIFLKSNFAKETVVGWEHI